LEGGTHGFSNGLHAPANGRVSVIGNPAAITGPGLVNQVGGIVTTSFGGLVLRVAAFHHAGMFGTVINSAPWIIAPTTNVLNNRFITTDIASGDRNAATFMNFFLGTLKILEFLDRPGLGRVQRTGVASLARATACKRCCMWIICCWG
jgi:hypothetical protein